jgi:hypothetical protein
MTASKPLTYSAADTARAISRRMRKAGFLMADTSNRFRWTWGYHVSRIGCSNLVSIDYHIPESLRDENSRAKTRERRAAVRSWLVEAGYTLDASYPHLVYIRCERD